MLIYVSHKYAGNQRNLYNAMKKTHDLQINDPENCYICPLCAFSYLGENELSKESEENIYIDLLSVCDVLLISSNITKRMEKEINFANMVGMEVRYIEQY